MEDPLQLQFRTKAAGWQTKPGEFHGARAQIGLWPIPDVKSNSTSEYSMAMGNDKGFVVAGFHLKGPQSTDCYNTECPGFVVADGATLHPGQVMAPPLSTYDKDDYSITLTIKKDEQTKDWSLYSTSLGKTTKVGWWSKTLFAFDTASAIEFRGSVFYNYTELSPPMGSGHFAKEGEKKSAYFKQITLIDKNDKEYVPSPDDMFPMQHKKCYTVSALEETPDHGRMFYYGGPSGCKSFW
ncbi:hypothetical protein LUZ60_003020 [Juncus effusus]|nr:hypothetical protein LUZ60_003020 [Juncus effusus]